MFGRQYEANGTVGQKFGSKYRDDKEIFLTYDYGLFSNEKGARNKIDLCQDDPCSSTTLDC